MEHPVQPVISSGRIAGVRDRVPKERRQGSAIGSCLYSVGGGVGGEVEGSIAITTFLDLLLVLYDESVMLSMFDLLLEFTGQC